VEASTSVSDTERAGLSRHRFGEGGSITGSGSQFFLLLVIVLVLVLEPADSITRTRRRTRTIPPTTKNKHLKLVIR
jgi:hypothetical protein